MSTIIRAKISRPDPLSIEPTVEIVESVIVMDCKTPSFRIIARTSSGFTDSNEKVIVISDINQKEQSIEDFVTNEIEVLRENYYAEFGVVPDEFLFKEIPE